MANHLSPEIFTLWIWQLPGKGNQDSGLTLTDGYILQPFFSPLPNLPPFNSRSNFGNLGWWQGSLDPRKIFGQPREFSRCARRASMEGFGRFFGSSTELLMTPKNVLIISRACRYFWQTRKERSEYISESQKELSGGIEGLAVNGSKLSTPLTLGGFPFLQQTVGHPTGQQAVRIKKTTVF